MRTHTKLTVFSLLTLCASATVGAATWKTVEKTVPAEAQGVVTISNTSGSVKVTGWDRPEVSVRAEIEEGVERVDVDSDHGKTNIAVIVPHTSTGRIEANLIVQVPRGSELHVSTVSADQTLLGITGAQHLNSVSGDVNTEIAGADLELRSVSGDIKVKGHGQPAHLHVSSVSGDVHLEHGGGDLDISSVSGSLVVSLDTAGSVRARTTSGDVHFDGKLKRGASFEASTVSGDIAVRAPGEGGYTYEVSTFSGDITDCFSSASQKTPGGHSLNGTRGEGDGRVRLKAMSGDVQLCDRN
jgi:DUF4097 and DUF4098 domain-containing protein YvlB